MASAETLPARAAVVGAGPSGFYAADQLLDAGFEVDVYDVLPTPFGLVRTGVAPDHPKIKSVTRVYERTAARAGFSFFGGVELGANIARDDLLQRYHAVIYAVGTAADRRLHVPGEQRPGSVAATDFVAWYNGHPAFCDHAFDLSCDRAVVIGNGNVAIDVARMLVLDADELAATDMADHAIEALVRSSVREVVILGRRGPAQAAFTTPELRELGQLNRVDVIVDPADLDDVDERHVSPAAERNLAVLREYAAAGANGKSHRIVLRFLRSPAEICGERDDGPVQHLRVVTTRLGEDGRATPTGEEESIPCGLVIRSIGYRGTPQAGMPFDEERGLIRNVAGRVVDADGRHLAGEYTVGWIKRGPSGVIGTNKKDSAETTRNVIEDRVAGRLNRPPSACGAAEIEQWLRERVGTLVTWNGWQTVDRHEQAAGARSGRPRVKLVRTGDIHALLERADG